MKSEGKPPITNRGVTEQSGSFAGKASRGTINEPVAIASGIDWLTVTTTNDATGLVWYDVFSRYAERTKDWRNKWYEGKQAEKYRWGYSSKQGYIFVCTGRVVPEIFALVVPAAKNVTRVDFQVTVELPKAIRGLAENYYASMCDCKKRKYALIKNSKGGSTLYVGSRQSEQFGRVYDKGVESGEFKPGLLWRYEVELKGHRGDAIARRLLAYHPAGNTERIGEMNRSVRSAIVPAVYDWFEERGVPPLFDKSGDNELVVEIGRTVTTDDRKLEWLTSQVKPTVQDFVARGLEDKLEEALGIWINRPF